VFSCCGFLSFSLVFCRFGGRCEASLYIHFTRRWVKSRRHSSAPRKDERGRRGGKGAPFFAVPSVGLVGVFGVVGGVRRVGLRLSRLSFALRRLGAAGGIITLRYYYRVTNARLLRRGASARR